MDAIILAGGKGTRMRPLTDTKPKPLLEVQGQSLLERTLRVLPASVDHVLIVVHYLKEQIIDFMARREFSFDYTIVEQSPAPQGTGHALLCCQPYLRSDGFLVLNGDDLYDSGDVANLAEVRVGVLGTTSDDPSRFGVLVVNTDGHFVRIHEKPPKGQYPASVLISTGAFKFHHGIFTHPLTLSARGEYEITDYLTYITTQEAVKIVQAVFWFPVGTPAALEAAQTLRLP